MAHAPQDRPQPEALIRFLRNLRAVRAFRGEPVPREVVDAILEVVRWSGSASNRQPWEVVVIEEPDTLRRLAAMEGYARHLGGAPLGIVLVMRGEPDRADQETFDEGRLSERIMLAAEAFGVGSSIGWLVGRGQADAKSLLGIPPGRLVRTVISLGYPAEQALRARPKPAQARKPLREIVHYGRYGQATPGD